MSQNVQQLLLLGPIAVPVASESIVAGVVVVEVSKSSFFQLLSILFWLFDFVEASVVIAEASMSL